MKLEIIKEGIEFAELGLICYLGKHRSSLSETYIENDTNLTKLGRYYYIKETLERASVSLKSIRETCFHGLNNTIPEDFYKFREPYDLFDPYEDIKNECSYEIGNNLILSDEILNFLNQVPSTSNAFSQGFMKFFPGVSMSVVEEGHLRKMTPKEVIDRYDQDYLKKLEYSFSLETYNLDMEKIAEIVNTKGSLKEILELT